MAASGAPVPIRMTRSPAQAPGGRQRRAASGSKRGLSPSLSGATSVHRDVGRPGWPRGAATRGPPRGSRAARATRLRSFALALWPPGSFRRSAAPVRVRADAGGWAGIERGLGGRGCRGRWLGRRCRRGWCRCWSGAISGATGAGSGLGWPRATGAVIIAAAVSAPSAPNRRSAPIARVTFLGLAVVPKGQYASAFGPVKWPPARPRGRAGNSHVSLSSSVDCDCSSAALALRQGLRKHVLVRRQRPREGAVGLRERATVTLTRALEPQREGLVGRVDLL